MAYDYRGARDRIFGISRDSEGKLAGLVPSALSMTERVLLLALVEFAPNIEPSTATLAAMCGTDERSVRRLLRACEAKGYVLVEHRTGMRSRYTLTLDPGLRVPPDVESVLTQSPETPDSVPGPPRTESPPKQASKAGKKADADPDNEVAPDPPANETLPGPRRHSTAATMILAGQALAAEGAARRRRRAY